MNVLHVTSSYPRDDEDTNGQFVADLVAASAAAGLTVSVVAPHAPGLAGEAIVAGAPVHRFRYGPARLEILAYRGGMMAAARRPLGLLMVLPYLAASTSATLVQVRR